MFHIVPRILLLVTYMEAVADRLPRLGKRELFLCPPNRRGGGQIVFGADPVGVGVREASFPRVIF